MRDGLCNNLLVEIRRLGLVGGEMADGANNLTRVGAQAGYQLHNYDGRFNRVPQGWRLPVKATTRAVWIAYNCGNTVDNIPPLRSLIKEDVMHLDNMPLLPGEKKRREARKILSDLKTLCKHIQLKAEEQGCFHLGMSRIEVGECFDKVASVENGLVSQSKRHAQIRWTTTKGDVEKKKKEARNAAAATQRT
jgi:hypothetical protein